MRGGNSRYGIRAQLSSSHCHAGDLRGFRSAIVHSRVARWGDILVVTRRFAPGFR